MTRLTDSLRIRDTYLTNRLVMAPMATHLCTVYGRVTDDLCAYVAARVEDGVLGCVITEHACVSPEGRHIARQLDISDDRAVPGLARLARAIHARQDGSASGTVALCQISHAGSIAQPADPSGGVLGPSALVHPGGGRHGTPGVIARAMTIDDIRRVVGCFAAAARRAMAAGFDGVEIHAAHGYLLDQFLSPLTNQRRDAYGAGSVEDRARLTCEVTAAVREAVGERGVVAVRIGACDYAPGGTTIEDGVQVARLVAQAGADLIDVSGGMFNFSRHALRPPAYFRDASAPVREAVRVPVLTAGGIRTAREADALLAAGACDLVGVGKAFMRDQRFAWHMLHEQVIDRSGGRRQRRRRRMA